MSERAAGGRRRSMKGFGSSKTLLAAVPRSRGQTEANSGLGLAAHRENGQRVMGNADDDTRDDGDGRDLREEDEENDDNGENAGEEEDTYLSDGAEEEDDDSDFEENILNGLEDSAVVEDCSWSVSTVITKEYVLVAQHAMGHAATPSLPMADPTS
uniref:Uncharacterized protein n=1 Tax=Ananas comosus var. bracteatus TaxID=296719 RepID=A0A6V7PK65_ANACO|nr:unnamed protein product [Ananas comosus var. bracteatus]